MFMQKICTSVLRVAIFKITKTGNHPRLSFSGWAVKQTVEHPHAEFYSAIKTWNKTKNNNENPKNLLITRNNLGCLSRLYAEWAVENPISMTFQKRQPYSDGKQTRVALGKEWEKGSTLKWQHKGFLCNPRTAYHDCRGGSTNLFMLNSWDTGTHKNSVCSLQSSSWVSRI